MSRVSQPAVIREMDASQLVEYARRMQIKIDEETITPEELNHLTVAKANFKQLTGMPLTKATMEME